MENAKDVGQPWYMMAGNEGHEGKNNCRESVWCHYHDDKERENV